MEIVRLRSDFFPGGTLCRRPIAPGNPSGPRSPAARRGRLKIGYQITADRLQAQVELAYRTERRQVLTTILWGGRIDDLSRRLVTDALLVAAHEDRPVCIHVFATAARDLFRHISRILAARQRCRARRGCFARPARNAPALDAIPRAAPLDGDLLAAVRDLRQRLSHSPHVTIQQDIQADASTQGALSALQELSDLIADYLELVLWPLAPCIGPHAVRAFILETRREPRELASSRAAGDVYVETLTVIEPHDNAVILEVEGSLGGAAP